MSHISAREHVTASPRASVERSQVEAHAYRIAFPRSTIRLIRPSVAEGAPQTGFRNISASHSGEPFKRSHEDGSVKGIPSTPSSRRCAVKMGCRLERAAPSTSWKSAPRFSQDARVDVLNQFARSCGHGGAPAGSAESAGLRSLGNARSSAAVGSWILPRVLQKSCPVSRYDPARAVRDNMRTRAARV